MFDIEELVNLIQREVARATNMIPRPRHLLVTSYDPSTHSIKGTFEPEGIPSGWLPLGTLGASLRGISQQVGPMPGSEASGILGDLALVLYAEGDPEAAHVLGFLHNDVDRPPGAQAGQHIIQHNPTKVQQLIHALGHFISAPKLASSVISQTITHFAQDLLGNSTANISHTADDNISHTANTGNITHTASQGNITHSATNGTITHTAQSISQSSGSGNIAQTSSSGNIVQTASNGNISHSAPNGTITYASQNVSISASQGLALNLPTSSPTPGSGLVWNNSGVVNVA